MPRHASMAEQLAPTMAWRDRPETEGPVEPVKTNWSTVAANDNNPEDVVDFGHERKILITPSVREIMRQVETGPMVRNEAGQIIRIGTLRFSDGTQTEKAYTNGPDGKLIRMDARMPSGAMLGMREETEAALGGKSITQRYAELSNSYFAASFGVEYPRYIRGGKVRREVKITAEERKALLAGPLPPITYCPPALPCGTKNVADAFNGMKKGRKGESGSIPWVDLATLQSNRSRWREVMRELKPKTKKVLDAAMSAKNMAEIGALDGYGGKHAQRRGKAALIAANDNLAAAIAEYVA